MKSRNKETPRRENAPRARRELEPCARCAAAPPGIEGALAAEVETLQDNEEIERRFPQIIPRTDVLHTVDHDGLLALYDVAETRLCCFADQTPHNNGAVVRTRCADIYAIGCVCGERHVAGFKKARSNAERSNDRLQLISTLRSRTAALLSRLEGQAEEFERFFRYKEKVERHAPTFWVSALQLAKEPAPKGIPGISLFTSGSFERANLERKLGALAQLVEDAYAVTVRNVSQRRTRQLSLEQDAGDFLQGLAHAARFATNDVLRRIAEHASNDRLTFKVEGAEIVFWPNGHLTRLALEHGPIRVPEPRTRRRRAA